MARRRPHPSGHGNLRLFCAALHIPGRMLDQSRYRCAKSRVASIRSTIDFIKKQLVPMCHRERLRDVLRLYFPRAVAAVRAAVPLSETQSNSNLRFERTCCCDHGIRCEPSRPSGPPHSEPEFEFEL